MRDEVACAECEGAAVRCRRCGRGCCMTHVLPADRICAACEVEYFEGRDQLRLHAWFWIGVCIPVAIFMVNAGTLARLPNHRGSLRAITTTIPLLDAALLTLVFAYFSGKLLVAIRTSLYRRRFRGTPIRP